jgi:predicted Zn-dependent peptidase
VVSGVPATGLGAFHAARYVPGNVVIAAAGSVDHDALVALAEAAGGALTGPAAPAAGEAPPELGVRRRFVAKETEQYHVCLGGPGIARDDDRRFALRVLDNVLGGSSSSRLFQEVRERRGLAYSVFSFQALYAQAGQVGLYLGTRPDNVQAALKVVADELERLRDGAGGVTADELSRSKENTKGRIVLGLESTSARMHRLGSSVLAGMALLSLDELVERIDAVTLEDVGALAAELFDPARLSAAGIGADEAVFRRALAPVSLTLAEAA